MSQNLWKEYLGELDSGRNLSVESIQWCMNEILTGQASNEDIKSFLLSLKAKGETAEEIGALVSQMYRYSSPISIAQRAVDTVGTGGDGGGDAVSPALSSSKGRPARIWCELGCSRLGGGRGGRR